MKNSVHLQSYQNHRSAFSAFFFVFSSTSEMAFEKAKVYEKQREKEEEEITLKQMVKRLRFTHLFFHLISFLVLLFHIFFVSFGMEAVNKIIHAFCSIIFSQLFPTASSSFYPFPSTHSLSFPVDELKDGKSVETTSQKNIK